jgi:ribonuclease HII
MAVAVSAPATRPRRKPSAPGPRLLTYDRRLEARFVGGADEAGRGALAGPLVAAAVLLEPNALTAGERRALRTLDDSKCCTERVRDELYPTILALARSVAVVAVVCTEVDRLNIHQANLWGLARALDGLAAPPEAVLLSDGFRLPGLTRPHRRVIGGDRTSAAVAAASIVAKVTRDRVMRAAHLDYPDYGFDGHVGYATPEHRAALRRLGPSPIHRRSFAPCSQTVLPLDV